MIEMVLIGGMSHGTVRQSDREKPFTHCHAIAPWPLLDCEAALRLYAREQDGWSLAERYTYLGIHEGSTYYYGVV